MRRKFMATIPVVLVLVMFAGSTLVFAAPIGDVQLEQFSALQGVQTEPLSESELSKIEAKGTFSYGYCTWYVDKLTREKWGLKNGVPWQGNAVAWYNNAKKAGYKTGKTPKKNSIVVYNEKFYPTYGHVAYVTAVDGNNFTVTEMNVKGRNKSSTRKDTTKNNNKIAGFIYK